MSRPISRIVFLGSFGPPSLAFARSCRSMGVSVHLLVAGTQSSEANPSSCIASIETLDERIIGQPEGIKTIVEFCRKVRADALTTLSEVHCLWLARNKSVLESVGCKVLAPSFECLERLASKVNQIALAHQAGLNVLPTRIIRNVLDAACLGAEYFPVCLRPAAAGTCEPPFKLLMAKSAEDLLRQVEPLCITGDGLIAQPFRVLPNLIVHCASREGGQLMSAAAFIADRKFEGLALRIRPTALPDDLRSSIARFSSIANLSGPYHLDFLYNPETGDAYYLEVNARFGGTTDKVLWFGVNEAANCLSAYGLTPPHGARRFETGRNAVVNKRATLKHLLTMLRRGPEPWDFPLESRAKAAFHSLGDMLLAKDSIWDRQDIKGTLAFHLQGLLS